MAGFTTVAFVNNFTINNKAGAGVSCLGGS